VNEQDWARVHWRKSQRCLSANQCVEVAVLEGLVGVRDSKDPDRTILLVDRDAWAAFIDAVKRGEFDRPDLGESSDG
jgi:hypothetical protein